MSNIYASCMQHIGNVWQTSTISSSYIYTMYDAHIGFSHRAEPMFIWCGAYTHIVSIGSAACQEQLETTSEATPWNVKS